MANNDSAFAKSSSSLASYMSPPSNYVGTALFLLYIIAALALTAFLVYDILSDPRIKRYNATRAAYMCLASSLLVFLTSSFNMLTFLYHNILLWAERTGTRDLPMGSMLWRWMLESTLFRDFAQQLAQDSFAWWYVPLILGHSAYVSAQMGIRGWKDGTSTRKLVVYFALAQILPPGFAFSLFNTKMNLNALFGAAENLQQPSPPDHPMVDTADGWEELTTGGDSHQQNSSAHSEDPLRSQTTSSVTKRTAGRPMYLPFIPALTLTVVIVDYFIIPKWYADPYYRPQGILWVLLLTRVFLCVPLFPVAAAKVSLGGGSTEEIEQNTGREVLFQVVPLMAVHTYQLLSAHDWNVIFVLLRLLTTFTRNDAVRTLVMDFAFGGYGVDKYGVMDLKSAEARIVEAVRDKEKREGGVQTRGAGGD